MIDPRLRRDLHAELAEVAWCLAAVAGIVAIWALIAALA